MITRGRASSFYFWYPPRVIEHEGGRGRVCTGTEFRGTGLFGEVHEDFVVDDVLGQVDRLIDPSYAIETIHWGRNYLYTVRYEAKRGPVEVVVKQFRNQGFFKKLERRLKGSKATRSWRVAKALVREGINTPRPVMLIESEAADGPSFFVAERLKEAHEVRHFFRRIVGDPDAAFFPEVETGAFLEELARLARRLHDAGIIYRDLSLGNVLATVDDDGNIELHFVDFNRARISSSPGVYRRTRDICRFPIVETAHRQHFLKGYWGKIPSRWSVRWWLFALSVRGYILKHQIKGAIRGQGRTKGGSARGTHHAHIPVVEKGVSSRDKSVWDHLSDQPHQHAGRFEKLSIRFRDAGSHLYDFSLVVAALPGVWLRYRSLRSSLYKAPVEFSGTGLCIRPWDDLSSQLELIDELGVQKVMIRLHPWDQDHSGELALAAALHERGVDLSFALPQNRELVRNLDRWRASVVEIGKCFSVYSRQFQIGQAVNRSKWGIWTRSEYVRLFTVAAEVLRDIPDVELIGPSVIDFEHQVTAAIVNRRKPGLNFDIVSSLLYVDRRGAPENEQLGFDTVGKIALLKAIAEKGRSCSGRCWITEVNWPLWEGPHSPAGRTVSVDEQSHANFLVRYYLLALGTGMVERVYWWRLIARGYGLVAPSSDASLRRRPAFYAFKVMFQQLEGSLFLGPLPAEDGVFLYAFQKDGSDFVVAWCLEGEQQVDLGWLPIRIIDRDGEAIDPSGGSIVKLTPRPRYFFRTEEGNKEHIQ